MAKSNLFVFQLFLSFLGLTLILNNSSSLILNFIFLVLIGLNFFLNSGKLFSIVSFYTILFSSALIPILLVNFGVIPDVVTPNIIRVDIMQDNYYGLALDILILSTLIMSSYLNLSTSFKVSRKDRVDNFKPIYYEIFIIFSSYMINKDSSILFLDAYRGDGYVDGESFGGWAVFFIMALSYYVYKTNLASQRNLYFCYFVIFFWFIFANRGEIFPILFFVLYATFSRRKKFRFIQVPRYVYALVLVLSFLAIGVVRSGNYTYSGDLLLTLLSNNTGGPVAYSFMSILYHTQNFGFENGATFIDYLYRTLPSFIIPDRPGDVSMFLVKTYSTGGGNLLIGEPYLNFGVLGVFAFLNLFLMLIVFIEKKASVYREFNLLYILFIFLGTRTVLYGFITFYKLAILFIGLLFIYLLFNGGKIILNRRTN
tara:strand:- start:13064 stop:14341 length:1278 start_codon:yes stop_codon:yes gene_type:complete